MRFGTSEVSPWTADIIWAVLLEIIVFFRIKVCGVGASCSQTHAECLCFQLTFPLVNVQTHGRFLVWKLQLRVCLCLWAFAGRPWERPQAVGVKAACGGEAADKDRAAFVLPWQKGLCSSWNGGSTQAVNRLSGRNESPEWSSKDPDSDLVSGFSTEMNSFITQRDADTRFNFCLIAQFNGNDTEHRLKLQFLPKSEQKIEEFQLWITWWQHTE